MSRCAGDASAFTVHCPRRSDRQEDDALTRRQAAGCCRGRPGPIGRHGIFVNGTLINRALEARECRCVRLVSAPSGRRTGSRFRERARRSSWPTAGFPDASVAIVRGLLAIRHQRPCATNSTCPPRLKWTANAGHARSRRTPTLELATGLDEEQRSPAHRPSCCVHLGMPTPSPESSRLLSWNNLSGLPRQQRHCPSVARPAVRVSLLLSPQSRQSDCSYLDDCFSSRAALECVIASATNERFDAGSSELSLGQDRRRRLLVRKAYLSARMSVARSTCTIRCKPPCS